MDKKEEKQILEWVYHTAKQEYDRIDKLLCGRWTRGQIDQQNLNTWRVYELLAYQQSLLRILKKIRRQMSDPIFWEIQNSTVVSEISYHMKQRTEGLKYQIHENKHGGIFAWEIAKDLIGLEENLSKKIRNQW